MDLSRSHNASVDKDSMISGSSSDAESLSSSVEMNIIVQSDSSGRLDISSAVCASSEGDTSSMDASIVTALDLSHGPSVANIKVGPFRPTAKESPGIKYLSWSVGSPWRSFHEKLYNEFDWLEYSIE